MPQQNASSQRSAVSSAATPKQLDSSSTTPICKSTSYNPNFLSPLSACSTNAHGRALLGSQSCGTFIHRPVPPKGSPKDHTVTPSGCSTASSSHIAPSQSSFPAAPVEPKQTQHWSVFYPNGVEVLPPLSVHYLNLGCWCTVAGGWDYFSHRALAKGEVAGHQVEWLHTACPRDRFVFLVGPVEARTEKSLWNMIWETVYGKPPAFAFSKGKLLWRIQESSVAEEWDRRRKRRQSGVATPTPNRRELGVEAIEVLHSDITAMDYSPGLTSSRLALETQVASSLWFSCAEEAYQYYGCLDKMMVSHCSPPQSHNPPPNDAPSSVGLFPPPPPFGKSANGSFASTASHVGTDDGLPPDKSSKRHKRSAVCEGGEEMDSRSFRLPTAQEIALEHRQQPVTPLPSPAAQHIDTVDDEAEEVPEIQLPPASHFASVMTTDNFGPLPTRHNALSNFNTPNISPELHPKQHQMAVRHALSSDQETLMAERAAAALLFQSTAHDSVKPRDIHRHYNTMVTVYTQDPHFNAVLREVLLPDAQQATFLFTASQHEQKRLLSLYEAGMPTWTIFVTRYGLPYRRWFRLAAVMLMNIWPIIALCVGLYDLYKHMPYLKEFLADTLTPFTSWMDTHFTLRISMLVTYLITVTYSVLQAFHAFVKSFVALANFAFQPVIPLLQLLSLLKYPALMLWSVVTFAFGPLISVVTGIFSFVSLVLTGPFRAIYFLYTAAGPAAAPQAVQQASYFVAWWRSWLDFWDKVARPIKNVAKAAYDGVVHVGVIIARREASIRRWYIERLRRFSHFVEIYFDVLFKSVRLTSFLLNRGTVVGILVVLVAVSVMLFSVCAAHETSPAKVLLTLSELLCPSTSRGVSVLVNGD